MEGKIVKYPVGVQDFEKLITRGYLYVDKTEILYRLINEGNCYFLSRPRRFGKSLTLSTLKAYFEGKKELFEGLAIYDLERDWKKHPVFLLSFARFEKNEEQNMEKILEFYLSQWEEIYGIEKRDQNFSNRFASIVKTAYETTGAKVVVLIDEYDSALVSTLENRDLHNHIKSLLKPLYTVLKDFDMYIQFSLITGITRFSKLTIFSGLNNLEDISLNKRFGSICGITQKELELNFKEGIEDIGQRYGLDVPTMLNELKVYYDGYHFTEESEDIYNPFSILNVLKSQKLGNYWFTTGVPSFLIERLKNKDINLEKYMNQSTGEEMLKEADSAYTSDLAILFQAGFLTIKDYDLRKNIVKLGIPNREVREGMSKLFMEKFLCPDKQEGQNLIFDLVEFLEKGDPEKFFKLLKGFFARVPFDLSKGDKEVYFQNSFYILASLIGLNVETERHTSQGSIDLVISTSDYLYVIEIKLNKKAQLALDQINSKEYALQWENGRRKIFKIGATFSSRTRTLREWIIEE